MSELTAERFQEFFQALWGKDKNPFSWQRELTRRVIVEPDKPWPDAIALPTASGKTACIDIAVYALAAQAEHFENKKPITAARRIFFVVDRRIIVDEAYVRARKLAKRLREEKDGILKEVADRLRMLARGSRDGADNEDPLAVFELRGGMYRSEAWARSPLQPTVVASTVDQLGSRLLFRAYGRGPGMWPVYAGLIGNDSLILLDEAHCAQPFLQTLQAVGRYRNWAAARLRSRFDPVVMSATPPAGLHNVFRDASEEPLNPNHPLGKRQLASKPAALEVVERTKGKNTTTELARALVAAAEGLAEGSPKAVVIFVNRVATARAAHRLLADKHSERAILLTGRMRPIDRDDTVVEKLKVLASNQSEERLLHQPIFVVATQTLEVGADLDFDALVTECASLDALRQRFGRLNRMGRSINARAAVLIRADQAENSENDPVYGAALAKTWAWLHEQAGVNQKFNFGINALNSCLPDEDTLASLNAPAANAPVMLPAHIDCWVQTSPQPMPTPDVAPFLRGPDRGSADVQVCWRADIDLHEADLEAQSKDTLALCPPAAAECLPVPISVFKRWMEGEERDDETADVESAANADDELRTEREPEARRVLRWRSRKDVEVTNNPSDIRPGDIIVLPTYYEHWEALGDLTHRPDTSPTLDWGDRAHRQIRGRAQLRLNPQVVVQWPEGAARSRMLELAHTARARYNEDPDTLVDEIYETLRFVRDDESAPRWIREIVAALASDKHMRRGIKLHPLAGLIIKGNRRLRTDTDDADLFSDEDDASSSGAVRVPLVEHLPGVASHSKRFAVGCGLPEVVATAIERAGMLHDLGKADPRFQALLRNGNPWTGDVLLAKSSDIPQGRVAYERARKAAGYPEGGRHELLSVRMVENADGLLPTDKTLRDLILHLVASHHGYCRPFAPVIFDEKPLDVKFEFEGQTFANSSDTGMARLDAGVADRFWRLVRHYGWWGLAWLEAVMRLADHRRSEAEAEQREDVSDD